MSRLNLILYFYFAATLFNERVGIEVVLGNNSKDDNGGELPRRKTQAICGAGEGLFRIEAKYFGEPGTFDIATTPLGTDTYSPEEYHLKPAQNDLTSLNVIEGCFVRNKLHRFVVYIKRPPNPQDQAEGTYSLYVNGALHAQGTTLRDENTIVNADNVTFNEYYFAGDQQVCRFTVRFSLRIQFDNYPQDVSWELWKKDTEKMPLVSYTETLKAGVSFYTSDFKNDTLLVDRCLPADGIYTFTISDFIKDFQMIPFFLYEISVSGKVLAIGTTSEVTTFKTSGEVINTQAPSTLEPSSAPFPSRPTSPLFLGRTPEPQPVPGRRPAATTPTSFSEPLPPRQFCFSGSMIVEVKHRGPVEMRDLLLGDEVEVGRGRRMDGDLDEKRYEPIYSFGHYDPQGMADFLEIKLNSLEGGYPPLEISDNHMLFNERMKAVAAKHYKVGDLLLLPDGRAAQILSIRRKSSLGVFAPFTPSGTIVVNGIVASTFIDVEWPLVSGQWVARSFEAPHRLICTCFSNWCKRETYSPSDNLSYWVHYASRMNDWVSDQHLILKVVAFVIAFATLLAWSAISSAWNYSVAAFVLVVAMAYVCKVRAIAVRKIKRT